MTLSPLVWRNQVNNTVLTDEKVKLLKDLCKFEATVVDKFDEGSYDIGYFDALYDVFYILNLKVESE